MKIKPLNKRAIIEPIEKRDRLESGIYLPKDIDTGLTEKGKITAVKDIDSVKVGDMVFFSKFGPSEIKIENKKYLIVSEEHILAIYES